MADTIISAPLDYPALIPDDWGKWWNIWETYSAPLIKTGVSPNNAVAPHVGFDVYKSPEFKPVYQASYVDLAELYPSLYSQIVSHS